MQDANRLNSVENFRTVLASHNRIAGLLQVVLIRLDLEARQHEDGAVFMLAGMREDIRKALAEAGVFVEAE